MSVEEELLAPTVTVENVDDPEVATATAAVSSANDATAQPRSNPVEPPDDAYAHVPAEEILATKASPDPREMSAIDPNEVVPYTVPATSAEPSAVAAIERTSFAPEGEAILWAHVHAPADEILARNPS
jgi:hypothetical protein